MTAAVPSGTYLDGTLIQTVATITPRRWAHPSRRAVRLILGATVLALLSLEAGVVGPYVERAAHSLGNTDLRWLALALVAELWSMVAFAHLQRRMLSVGGTHVPLRSMIGLTYAANAISVTLPAGTALSSGYTFRRMRGFGASAPLAGFTLITTGVLSTAAFALLGLTGSVAIGIDQMNPTMLGAEVLAAVGLAYLSHRVTSDPTFLHRGVTFSLDWFNRALRRPSGTGASAVHEFLRALSEIKPRNRDWAAGLAFGTANWLTDLICLVAACRAVGLEVSMPLVTVAFLAGTTVSSLSFLPGGLGVVDAAMIVTLTRGGMHIAPAAAAVVLYRLISFVLIAALGWLAWTLNWRRESPRTAALSARLRLRIDVSQRSHRQPIQLVTGNLKRRSRSACALSVARPSARSSRAAPNGALRSAALRGIGRNSTLHVERRWLRRPTVRRRATPDRQFGRASLYSANRVSACTDVPPQLPERTTSDR